MFLPYLRQKSYFSYIYVVNKCFQFGQVQFFFSFGKELWIIFTHCFTGKFPSTVCYSIERMKKFIWLTFSVESPVKESGKKVAFHSDSFVLSLDILVKHGTSLKTIRNYPFKNALQKWKLMYSSIKTCSKIWVLSHFFYKVSLCISWIWLNFSTVWFWFYSSKQKYSYLSFMTAILWFFSYTEDNLNLSKAVKLQTMAYSIFFSVILYHTIPTFREHGKKAFWKHCGERRIQHLHLFNNVFYPIKDKKHSC